MGKVYEVKVFLDVNADTEADAMRIAGKVLENVTEDEDVRACSLEDAATDITDEYRDAS